MKLESLKSQENNQKGRQISGKITKSSITFRENKANFKNINIGVSPFNTDKYEILPARRGKKQTQYKPKTNPIAEKAIINISSFMTNKYVKLGTMPGKKTNPNKPKTNPKQACPRCMLSCFPAFLPGIYPRMSQSGGQWDSKMLVLDFSGIQGKLWVTGYPLCTEDIIQLYSKDLLCLELIRTLYIQ